MSYAVQPPPVTPGRPPGVMVAAALLWGMAAAGLIYAIVTLAIVPGTVTRFRDTPTGAFDTLTGSDQDTYVAVVWLGASIALALGLIVLALYVVLGIALRRGSNTARIATLVASVLGVLGGLAAIVTVAVQRGGDSQPGSMAANLTDAYPSGWVGTNVGLAVAQVAGYLAVGVLLLTAPRAFFGRPERQTPQGYAVHPGPFQPGYPQSAPPGQPAHGYPAYPPPSSGQPAYQPYPGHPGAPGQPPPGYGAQPAEYGGQPSGYGAQPSGYGAQPSGYGSQPPSYGGQPSGYGSQSPSYGGQEPPSYGGQQPPGHGGQQSGYDGRPPAHGGQQPPGYGQGYPPPGFGQPPAYGLPYGVPQAYPSGPAHDSAYARPGHVPPNQSFAHPASDLPAHPAPDLPAPDLPAHPGARPLAEGGGRSFPEASAEQSSGSGYADGGARSFPQVPAVQPWGPPSAEGGAQPAAYAPTEPAVQPHSRPEPEAAGPEAGPLQPPPADTQAAGNGSSDPATADRPSARPDA